LWLARRREHTRKSLSGPPDPGGIHAQDCSRRRRSGLPVLGRRDGPRGRGADGHARPHRRHTSLDSEAAAFESSLVGCESGTVVNADSAQAHFTPWGGVFIGDKEFTCAGGLSGFTLRLKARFGGGGSTGSWTAVGGWGGLAGLKGSGSLVGISVSDIAIDDIYSGSVR